eukprot:5235872-Pyramimonas_sp.AAC.1
MGHDPRAVRAEMARRRHANPVIEAVGGAPHAATILVRGAPTWPEAAMRTMPRACSVELPMGPRSS